MRLTFIFFSIISVITISLVTYAPGGLFRIIGLGENTTIIIGKGESTNKIGNKLVEKKIVSQPISFLCGAFFLKLQKKTLKHGEYLIEANHTLWQLLQKIVNGDVVIHYLTISEGLTVYEIAKKIDEIGILTGNLEDLPPEGSLLPQTYDYYYGDSKQGIIKRMAKAMDNLKSLVWPQYQNSCLLKSWDEVLTLASIVEKETSISAERSMVASVYLNRLKANMPLQADPTIIYARTNGQTSFYRPILKSELALQSPFNTYLQKGLPPTPIACPGEASILAVLKPALTSYLYFVANGTGGHEFSNNLKAHNQNVRNWRIIEKQKKEYP